MKYLKDYTPPPFFIDSVELHFNLEATKTVVNSRLVMRRNAGQYCANLRLDGSELELLSLKLDGKAHDHTLDAAGLTIACVPDRFVLDIETGINPEANSSLMGLYTSNGNFYTQCEAEGFRKITYFLDRPDAMSIYTVTIVANKARYPVLLSNGNRVECGELDDGRHYAKWVDPYRKPSYLFALVAGNLGHIPDDFVTRDGRRVKLEIYTEHGNESKCEHAMRSLKNAMSWDEKRFGLSYDLDTYMIVAVSDFNMGAMENKGLNVFNSKYVLASSDTATDTDYENIEAVIGHEYFHNWTGNRVTCRDWFQLSLKEGLTVFRDQEFSADMGSRAVKRIRNVRGLRASQFQEDSGPTAHPIRPESYLEISNFYTATVYNKGAEVIRMMHTLLGEEGFRGGMDEYFRRHDGQAVTCEDFITSMEAAGGRSLTQFRLWYSQAGTPQIAVESHYDESARIYTLTVRQSIPATPGQDSKLPMHIPLKMALLSADGQPIPMQLAGEDAGVSERVLELTADRHVFNFVGVDSRPLPSLNRGFSAPVKLDYPYSRAELAFLMGADSDSFNRWEAGQRLMRMILSELVFQAQQGIELELDSELAAAFGKTLADRSLDPAFAAEMLQIPAENEIAETLGCVDPEAVHRARDFLRKQLGARFCKEFGEILALPADTIGKRSLRNLCLGFLALDPEFSARALSEYFAAENMTESLGALQALNSCNSPERAAALQHFEQKWQKDSLVLDKWFTIQATAALPDTLENVKALSGHPLFDRRNPNKVRALIGAFAHSNPWRFHSKEGYEFLTQWVLQLDQSNPQIASRLVMAFSRWNNYESGRRALMRAELEKIAAGKPLSNDVLEIATKCLAAAQ